MSLTNEEVASVLNVLRPHFSTRNCAIIAYWRNKTNPDAGRTVLYGDANAILYTISQMCRSINENLVGVEESMNDLSAIDSILSSIINSADEIRKNKDLLLSRLNEADEYVRSRKGPMYTQPMDTDIALQYIENALKPEDPEDLLVIDFYDGHTSAGGAIASDEEVLDFHYLFDALISFCTNFICKYSFVCDSDVVTVCSKIRAMLYPEIGEDDDDGWVDPIEALMQEDRSIPEFTIDDLRRMGFTDDEIRNSPNVPLRVTDEKLKKIGLTPEQFKEMFAGQPDYLPKNSNNTKPQ